MASAPVLVNHRLYPVIPRRGRAAGWRISRENPHSCASLPGRGRVAGRL